MGIEDTEVLVWIYAIPFMATSPLIKEEDFQKGAGGEDSDE